MIRNIIFDWSGTLVDDLPAVWRATNYVFAQAGAAQITLERFRAEFCLPFKDFYERHLPELPEQQLEEWFHSHFRQNQDQVAALPHAEAFLIACRERGVRSFALSTVHPDHFLRQAESSGFRPFFEQLYLGVLDKRKRIHELLKDNGLNPAETLYIGDMQHDIETAQFGGVFSCAVLTGYNSLEQLRASKPDLIVEHLGELRRFLDGHGWEVSSSAETESRPHYPIVTVGALIFNSAREVLMIRTHKWSNLWGIPGGKIKYGETSTAALQREIKEETNLDVANIRFVLVQDCIGSKEFYKEAHFVLLNYACDVAGEPLVILNEEAQEFRWVTVPEAFALPLNLPTQRLLSAFI